MSRKTEKLFDAITLVREDLIEEAQDYTFKKKVIPWQRVTALAASLLLVVGIGFGALRLGVFGGMGGSSKNNAAENCAPMEPESGADSENAAPTEDKQEPEAAMPFTATVLEIREGSILVEPDEGESIRLSADKVEVPTADLAELPELEAGDRVTVTFSGAIQETYPARITGVLAVEKLAE